MDLDDKINLRWDGEVRYSAKTTTVGGILTSTNYYTLQSRDKLLAEMSAAKKREEAILQAVKGVDTKSILAAIERAAVEDAARDTAAADALAEIAALVAKVGSGQLAVDEFLDALAARLSRVE